MRFVFFMHRDLAGNLSDICGSEGYMPLDQRWGGVRIGMEARAHARRLAKVRPGIIAYRVMAGASIREARQISGPHAI